MSDRWIDCPQCQRSIRLTAKELEEGIGFCALCDARFDIRPGRELAGPFRSYAPIEVIPRLGGPPTKWTTQSPDGLTLHRAGSLGMLALSSVVLFWLAVGRQSLPLLVAGGAWMAVSLTRVILPERLRLRLGELWHRRPGRLWWKRIPIGEIEQVTVDKRGIHLVGARSDRTVGRWMAHQRPTIRWVARWLENLIERVRSGGHGV